MTKKCGVLVLLKVWTFIGTLPNQPKEVKRPTIPMNFLEVLTNDGNPTHN
jgi:hypothetical protein